MYGLLFNSNKESLPLDLDPKSWEEAISNIGCKIQGARNGGLLSSYARTADGYRKHV